MKDIIKWWTSNPVAANLLMTALFIGGLVSFFTIDREIEPYVEYPGAVVEVTWLGASPQDIEDQILVRLEEALSSVQGVHRMHSLANESSGTIFVEGKSDLDEGKFLEEVKRKVDAINTFPAAAERPQMRLFRNRDEEIRLAVSGDDMISERELKHFAEKTRREIAQLSTVRDIELFGVRDEEVSIEVSETKLRQYSLTLDEVASAVRRSSVNASLGQVRTEIGNMQLRTRSQADDQDEFENIVIRQDTSGAIIRVKDIATVIDGFEQVNLLATMNGKRTILIQLYSGPNMDIVSMSEDVLAYIKKVKDTIPDGMSMTVWNNSNDDYTGRIETVTNNFITGLILVCLTLMLFLRPKIAIWVSIGIATAFAGGLMLLPLVGVSFNMISSFAFLLVIGVIVDDAIIVGEAIHYKTEEGERGIDAAINGTTMVVKPVIFAVLTTMIFFMPTMFFSGRMVEFTRAIGLVVILALIFSLIESLFILPAHLAKLKPVNLENPITRFQAKISDSLIWFANVVYRPTMKASLRRRYLTASFFVALMILTVGAVANGLVKSEFFPSGESDQIEINVQLPEGTPYARSLEILTQIQFAEKHLKDEIRDHDGTLIENWYTRIRDNDILALVKLVPPETRSLTVKETAERLRELVGEVPDAETITVNYQDQNTGPALAYVVNAKDPNDLRLAVEDLMAKLRSFDGVFNIINDTQSAAEEVQFDIKPEANSLGVTTEDIARQIRQGFFGAEVQRLPRDGEDVRVYVRYPTVDRESLDFLKSTRIRTTDGRELPLSSVADLRFEKGISRIARQERKRAVVISAEVAAERTQEIRDALTDDFFNDFDQRHPSVTRGSTGGSQEEEIMQKEMQLFLLIAIGVAYFLVAVSFKSYFEPILILLAAIPFCYTGAVLGHLIMGHPMSMLSNLGIFAAVGVAVNDNLVLLDYVHKLREKGMDGAEALVEAGTRRFRPILLTSLTTFIGLLPLLLERSMQAQWLIPIGISLAFGVIFALFVTLFLVPALYGIGADIRRYLKYLITGSPQPKFSARLIHIR